MNPDNFVKGKRLIDPMTGRVENENEEEDAKMKDEMDSFEMLEKSSTQSKRSKNVEMRTVYDDHQQ